MKAEYLKQLIDEMRQQAAINQARLQAVKNGATAFKQSVNTLQRDLIQTQDQFTALTTGIAYDTPVRNMNAPEVGLRQTGSY
ncbi:hypothetical protein [Mucilaginibacter koreensis]